MFEVYTLQPTRLKLSAINKVHQFLCVAWVVCCSIFFSHTFYSHHNITLIVHRPQPFLPQESIDSWVTHHMPRWKSRVEWADTAHVDSCWVESAGLPIQRMLGIMAMPEELIKATSILLLWDSWQNTLSLSKLYENTRAYRNKITIHVLLFRCIPLICRAIYHQWICIIFVAIVCTYFNTLTTLIPIPWTVNGFACWLS